MDITQNPNSYTYQLCRMRPSAETMFYDSSCSFAAMQTAVEQAVLKAKATPARSRFFRNLRQCCDKSDIERLCSNAVRYAKSY